MLLTDAHGMARVDAAGATVALTRINQAMGRNLPGPYQINAAIAACQMQPGGPDWPQIVLLYASLYRMEPAPIVQVNRAVALAETGHLSAALSILHSLPADLAG